LENLDDVPEALHGEYKEQKIGDQTVYVLDLDGVDQHPAVKSLKTAHETTKADRNKLRTENAALKAKVEGLPEDFDPDEYQRLKDEEEARQADPENKDVNARVQAATSAVKTQMEQKIE